MFKNTKKILNVMDYLRFTTFFLILTVFALNSPISMAQQDGDSGILGESSRDAFLILGTAGAGAILGLSTLSFVEKPGAHIKNVVVGGALGIIIGVGVVAYLQANKSKDLYLEGATPQDQGNSTQNYEAIGPLASAKDYYDNKAQFKKPPFVTFSFDF